MAVCSCARLDNNYLPPPGAASSGGGPGLTAPAPGGRPAGGHGGAGGFGGRPGGAGGMFFLQKCVVMFSNKPNLY